MGEPNYRLNPQVESQVQRILLSTAIQLLLSLVMLLPPKVHNSKGTKPYDYRVIIALCILRIMLRKTYADYEIEMRTDLRKKHNPERNEDIKHEIIIQNQFSNACRIC